MTSVDSSSASFPVQWDCFLKNLGAWQGSFTRLSAQGVVEEDIPSLVTLDGLQDNKTVHQTVQHFSAAGDRLYNKELEYSALNRSILFFEAGEFSQGSIQFAPFAEFGAELGFIAGDRRLRLVEQFNPDSQFSRLTLIREHRQGTSAAECPPLTVEQLLGNWQGEAITLYPDWRTPSCYTTTLSIEQEGDRLLQMLTAPQMTLSSAAEIQGNALHFRQGKFPIQVLLLPGGASANVPLTIPRGQPFFLEAGWLIAKNLRQRMIRHYDAQGGWSSLTLVTERKSG
jgi:Domain of unknown function (DUF3598)